MSSYRLGPEALEDISGIWHYIAEASETAADRTTDKLKQACEFVAEHPYAGHTRSDLTNESVFFWTVVRLPYLIVYEPHTSPVHIVRILHGARDIPSSLMT
jgi:plasmid stabilization system protein ParE